ncbi:ion transport protein [Nitzschia inconspicua]|uniref:Ion transport protein n=1 Tax=Nitzschia inconspicua TaxID=303405 RepID=A0A9K3LVL0_9STRA|nr:ion transport protein [Nitzschia inconspicua]
MPESYRKQLYYGVAPQPKYLFFPWYRWWFWLATVWSIFTVFYETFAVGFLPGGLSPAGNPASIIEFCFLTLFTTDIATNFNLAYTDQEDVVVTDRRMIIWNYFRGWFWIDLIAVFPFYIIILAARDEIGIDDFQTRNLQLIRLLRVVRLHRVVQALQVTQYSSKISLLWYTMVRDFGGAIMWTHFAACMMFFIARQRDFQDSWLEAPADTETNFDLYVTSQYWSIVTFVTVSYGDFSPVNATEQIFGMVYMFLNMVITSWIIGSITLLVVKNDEKNGEYRSNLRLLDEYVTINNFDDGIRKRLKTQLKLDFNNREISEENVLQHFPGTLRRKVIRQLYYPILSETHLMKNVRQVLVDSFLTSCSVELFGPGEDLIQRGTIPSDLYLLVDGSVKITSSTSVQTESVDKQ